jgi:teichuronic acid biosynthesis glycosyltransferase TuaC
MRVLVLTKIFPNRCEPLSSTFNRQQFTQLSRLCDVQILATVPWFPGAKAFARWSRAGRLFDVPRKDCIDGVNVYHPRYLFVPKIAPWLSGPLYVASLARTALRYRGKVDVILGSWAYPDGFAAVVLAAMLGTPAVIKLHGSDMNVVARLPGPRRWLQWAFPRAERIVAVSEPLRQEAIELRAASNRVDVVPNGVDRVRFRPGNKATAREALGLRRLGAMVLYVGNIEKHKGSLDLIRAYADLTKRRKNVSLVMVGSGAGLADCQALAGELGVDVSFAGAKPHDDIPQWIAACDVFVLPSWNEGTPNVVLEALACGRRVVATRVGGTPDVITSDTLGLLVPPRDPHALALGIETALSQDSDANAISAALAAPDWGTSAKSLHASLVAACEARALFTRKPRSQASYQVTA